MAFFGRVSMLLFLFVFPADSEFRFEDCSDGGGIIELSSFDVFPDPVEVRGNMTISFLGQILRDIPRSTELEVRYYGLRKVFGVQLDILFPCLFGKFGSCTLPLCNYVERYRKQVCPFFLVSSNGTNCECPPVSGNYTADDVEIPMERSPITRFFLKGKYRTEMRLKDKETEEELACFKFYTELA